VVEQLRGLVQSVVSVGHGIWVCAAFSHIGNGLILQVFAGSKNFPTLFESVDNILGDCVCFLDITVCIESLNGATCAIPAAAVSDCLLLTNL